MINYNFLILVLASILIFPFSLSAGEDSQLSKYLDRKCTNQITATKVKEGATALQKELDRAFGYVPDNMEHFCKNEKGFLINLMKEVADAFRGCVSMEEAYLPNFAGQSFVGFMHFMCHNYSEHMRDVFNAANPEAMNCMRQLRSETAAKEVDNCFNGILGPSSMNVLQKTDLCNDINTARRCFDRVINQECPGAQVLPRLNERLFKDLMDPCKEPNKQKHKFPPQATQSSMKQNPSYANQPQTPGTGGSSSVGSSGFVWLSTMLAALFLFKKQLLL